MTGHVLDAAIRQAARSGGPAVIPYLTAGFPTLRDFRPLLLALGEGSPAVEIGVPFSDPVADGATIQHASRVALDNGVTLPWILAELAAVRSQLRAAPVLMSYLNPLLAAGPELGSRCADAGVAGLIIPDLPVEECEPIRAAIGRCGIALIQMVSPVTGPDRLQRVCSAAEGFLYAVTTTGTTGGTSGSDTVMFDYLDRVRAASSVPVCAGFGIRRREQVLALRAHADGVIVGSALVDAITAGQDPARLLASLRS